MHQKILRPDAYAAWNYLASFGSYFTTVGILLFFVIIFLTLTSGKPCPADTWGTLSYDNTTSTLEWMVDSPPAFHTFDEIPRLFIATK